MSRQDEQRDRMPEEGGLPIQEPHTEDIPPLSNLKQDVLMRLGLVRKPVAHLSSLSIEQLSKQLRNTQEWQERAWIVQYLAEREEKAQVEKMIIDRLYEDPSEGVRMVAIRALGKLWRSGPVRLGPFLDALNDRHPWVRATTIQVLASLKQQDLTDQLIDMLKRKLLEKKEDEREDEIVHIAIIQFLSTRGSDDLAQVLLKILQDSDMSALVREAAVIALGSLDKDIAQGPLSLALYDDDRFVREAAVGLLKTGGLVKGLLHDLRGDSDVAAKAARALGELGRHSQTIEDALHRAATDANKSSSVRVAALLALAQLGTVIDSDTLALLRRTGDEDIRSAAEILIDVLQHNEESARQVTTDTEKNIAKIIPFPLFHEKNKER